jgi:hypothetical protein
MQVRNIGMIFGQVLPLPLCGQLREWNQYVISKYVIVQKTLSPNDLHVWYTEAQCVPE